METRLTRRPGQAGTKKYAQRYGELFVREEGDQRERAKRLGIADRVPPD